jgi:hypothetical protein
MSEWTESFRGVVYPWHCDHLGHMNVQHYVGMFDLKDRTSLLIPQELRASFEARLVETS